MDQHPIPQDVTGFQFKLIGTMTVKQFGFVASGVIMAVIIFYLPIGSPFAGLIKVILVPLFGVSGVIISFVPIDGRPIDVMTSNFVKALFSPNQYIYHREGRKLSFSTVSIVKAPAVKKTDAKSANIQASPLLAKQTLSSKEEKLRALLLNSHDGPSSELDKKEAAFLKTLALAPAPITKPVLTSLPKATPIAKAPAPLVSTTQAVTPAVTPAPAPNDTLVKKQTELEVTLQKAKQEESQQLAPQAGEVVQQKVTTLSSQIDQIHAQKQQLEQELAKLQTQLSEHKNTNPQPTPPTPIVNPAPAKPAIAMQDPKLVRIVPKATGVKRADLPGVSDTPNVIVGIVKDPRGNVLSNILVEVKDKEGNPVRAFKTNPLGQFASATPLSPGTYTMELEDPKKLQQFDVIQITTNNQIMHPIEIISHDAREELRKQLFSQ